MDRFQIIRGEEPPPNEFLIECDRDLEAMHGITTIELIKDPKEIRGLQKAWKEFSNNWADV